MSALTERTMQSPAKCSRAVVTGLLLVCLANSPAWAEDYPTRPIKVLVGYAPGGPADTIARLVGQSLSERLGQPFVVENRTGAGGNIGTESVVRAMPDGYTLLLASLSNAVNATLYKKLNFDFIRDIGPVASI